MRKPRHSRFIPCASCGRERWCRQADDLCRTCRPSGDKRADTDCLPREFAAGILRNREAIQEAVAEARARGGGA